MLSMSNKRSESDFILIPQRTTSDSLVTAQAEPQEAKPSSTSARYSLAPALVHELPLTWLEMIVSRQWPTRSSRPVTLAALGLNSRYSYSTYSHDTPCANEQLKRTELFEYTSGRWIFNEGIRRAQRQFKFDTGALRTIIAGCKKRPVEEVRSLRKLAEGGFNRMIEATFNDGEEVLVRLPYSFTVPKHYAIASEAATLNFLGHLGLPVPRVLDYSATNDNALGSEYILLDKIKGTCLGNIWYIIDDKARKKINDQVINIEEKLLRTVMPASGSLYHLHDLQSGEPHVAIESQKAVDQHLVIGPTCQYEWHYKDRTSLREHMGPWKTFLECFEAPAKRELQWCNLYGKPRQHVERHLRSLYNFQEISPAGYADTLRDYLKLAPTLDIPANHVLSRPVLRHPDLSPNNILVSDDYEIVGLIDWQHAVVRPLCLAAGIPEYFQNWGDPESERLRKPATSFPDNYDRLSPDDKGKVMEQRRRRLVHFLYAAKTMVQIPEHFEAINQNSAMLRGKLYERASWPWVGDSATLKHDLVVAVQSWPLTLKASQFGGDAIVPGTAECPVKYSQAYVDESVRDMQKQQEMDTEVGEMRTAMGIDAQGWVNDDEQYDQARKIAGIIKASLLEEAENEAERLAATEHFPFDDHAEE